MLQCLLNGNEIDLNDEYSLSKNLLGSSQLKCKYGVFYEYLYIIQNQLQPKSFLELYNDDQLVFCGWSIKGE